MLLLLLLLVVVLLRCSLLWIISARVATFFFLVIRDLLYVALQQFVDGNRGNTSTIVSWDSLRCSFASKVARSKVNIPKKVLLASHYYY